MTSADAHRFLASTFRVYLVPPSKTIQIPSPEQCTFLENLAIELRAEGKLEGEGEFKAVNRELFDRILVDRLTLNPPAASLFKYLSSSFTLAKDYQRHSSRSSQVAEWIKDVADLCVSYACVCLQYGDMFPQAPQFYTNPGKQLYGMIVSGVSRSPELNPAMLSAMVEHCKQNPEAMEAIFGSLLIETCTQAKQVTLVSDFLAPLSVLAAMLDNQPVLAYLVLTNPFFTPNVTGPDAGRQMQQRSWMAPFLEQSVIFQDNAVVCQQLFAGMETRGMHDVSSTIQSLRQSLVALHDTLHSRIFKPILTSSAETRNALLDHIGTVLVRNQSREKMRYDFRLLASEGYLMNLSAVCLRLCSPFLDPLSPKLKNIDYRYILFGKHGLFNDDQTRLNARPDEIQALKAKEATQDTKFPFICEIFFITMRSLHLSWHASVRTFTNLLMQYQQLKRQRERTDNADPNVKRLDQELDHLSQIRISMEAHMLGDNMLELMNQFYAVTMSWVTSIANPNNEQMFPSPPPARLCCLPEWIIEDIADFLIFLCRYFPSAMRKVRVMDMVMFCIQFMGNASYINNPYLRGKLVELVAASAPTQDQVSDHVYVFDDPAVAVLLMPALIRFYVDIEHTGRHDQFYHKFNARHHVSSLFQYLWVKAPHREAVKKSSHDDFQLFVKFVNMMINDLIFLLDEALQSLQNIRDIEVLMGDAEQWNALNAESQDGKRQQLQQEEQRATGDLAYGLDALEMMERIAKNVPEPFLTPELCPRIGAMLNYFLNMLAGPKCKNLKVKNKDKYKWNPKMLLERICSVYLCFSLHEVFVREVVADKRSYSQALFIEAVAILERVRSSSELITGFRNLQQQSAVVDKQADEDDIPESEIPDNLMDPIMSCLMLDPVKLPSSGITVDRATITRHLLNDPTDPFNRSHLTIDMVQPDEELAAQLKEFLASRKKGTKRPAEQMSDD